MTEVDPFANANPFATGSGGLARTPPGTPKTTKNDDLVPFVLCGGKLGGPGVNKFGVLPTTPPKDKVMLTTIFEHEELLWNSLGAVGRQFRPSIPNLIYQYSIFTNFPATHLDELNPEIDNDLTE